MNIKQIVFLAILLLVLIFALQNTQVVEVRFLFWKLTAVRAIVLGVTFVAGAVAGMLLDLMWRKRPATKNAAK